MKGNGAWVLIIKACAFVSVKSENPLIFDRCVKIYYDVPGIETQIQSVLSDLISKFVLALLR